MPDEKSAPPSENDAQEAARKIEEAGVADEGAAYSDAIGRDERTPKDGESEAHPS